MSKVIALANQKGGVGKTTTAVNLGAALAFLGNRTLIVDLDPQGNATIGLGVDRSRITNSVYQLLLEELP
ncbi:MAG: ParA family protein, partial [bacterium]